MLSDWIGVDIGIPRVSGGDPDTVNVSGDYTLYSPRKRG